MTNKINAYFDGPEGGVHTTLPISKERYEEIDEQVGGVTMFDCAASSDWYYNQETMEWRDVLNDFLAGREFEEVNDFAPVFERFEREEHRTLARLIEQGRVKTLYWLQLNTEKVPCFAMTLCGIDAGYQDYGFDVIDWMYGTAKHPQRDAA